MPKDTPNVTRGPNRAKLPFLGGYVATGGRGCNLHENEILHFFYANIHKKRGNYVTKYNNYNERIQEINFRQER